MRVHAKRDCLSAAGATAHDFLIVLWKPAPPVYSDSPILQYRKCGCCTNTDAEAANSGLSLGRLKSRFRSAKALKGWGSPPGLGCR